jgi:hypothetical protein
MYSSAIPFAEIVSQQRAIRARAAAQPPAVGLNASPLS